MITIWEWEVSLLLILSFFLPPRDNYFYFAYTLSNIMVILHGSNTHSGDLSLLCGKLHPTLEKLEQLREVCS